MIKNQSSIDRLARMFVGVWLLVPAFSHLHAHWGIIGVFPLVTGLVGFCPLYATWGLRTEDSRQDIQR